MDPEFLGHQFFNYYINIGFVLDTTQFSQFYSFDTKYIMHEIMKSLHLVFSLIWQRLLIQVILKNPTIRASEVIQTLGLEPYWVNAIHLC